MATAKEPHQLEMIDSYGSAEYFVTHIGKAELIDGSARIYWCSPRDTVLEVRCVLIIPLTRIAAIGRQCMTAAAELHNKTQWVSDDVAN